MKHLLFVLLVVPGIVPAQESEYDAIQEHYGDVLTSEKERYYIAQGECMAGIKRVNFAGGEYDPVAEWLRARTTQLLHHHEPCDVLLMIEVAERRIRSERRLNVEDFVKEKP